METSLIGKALAFGSNEYGFESRVSSLVYNFGIAYVLSSINVAAASHKLYVDLICTRRTTAIARALYKSNYVFGYSLVRTPRRPLIRVYLRFINGRGVVAPFRIFSKPSRTFLISARGVRFLRQRSGRSIFLVSTTGGFQGFSGSELKVCGGHLTGCFSL